MTVYFLITAFVVVIAPRTGVLYMLAIGLGQSRRAVPMAAFGFTLGILPHLLAAIFGLATLLHQSSLLFAIVKWAGVSYLLYLGWQMLRSQGPLALSSAPKQHSGWQGALINILNPKLSIFFLALLPPFLSGAPEAASREIIGLGTIFMVMTFFVFILYGVFCTIARDRLLTSQHVMRWFNRSFAALFFALGAKLAVERL
jgi:threonine/homoserine/homoserine lactone efflux protein